MHVPSVAVGCSVESVVRSPASNCCAVNVRAAPAGSVNVTSPPVASAPLSSRPPIVIEAEASPGLISLSRLTCVISVDKLKTGTS